MTEVSDDSNEGLRDELREIDQQIEQTTRDIDGLREQLTDGGPMDSEERAALLTNREELEGVLDGLRRRREALSEQLGGS